MYLARKLQSSDPQHLCVLKSAVSQSEEASVLNHIRNKPFLLHANRIMKNHIVTLIETGEEQEIVDIITINYGYKYYISPVRITL